MNLHLLSVFFSCHRATENVKGEELRVAMTTDPRVRPSSALASNQNIPTLVTSTKRPESAHLPYKTPTSSTLTSSNRKEYTRKSKEKNPISGRKSKDSSQIKRPLSAQVDREYAKSSRSSKEFKTSSVDAGYQPKFQWNESQHDKPAEVKVNSWFNSDSVRQSVSSSLSASTAPAGPGQAFLQNYLSQKLERTQAKEQPKVESKMKSKVTTKDSPPRNSFSSILEPQYEEDYSVLALTADMKKPSNPGYFMDTNKKPDEKYHDNFSAPRSSNYPTMHKRSSLSQSKENLLRESLEQMVIEEVRQSTPDEPDIDKKVSAMFSTFDPSNLEGILGKERFERLIKNFEESEDLVEGISSASGTNWLRESSSEGDSPLNAFISASSHHIQNYSGKNDDSDDDDVMNTLKTHRSDEPSEHKPQHGEIQIEISEPYKDTFGVDYSLKGGFKDNFPASSKHSEWFTKGKDSEEKEMSIYDQIMMQDSQTKPQKAKDLIVQHGKETGVDSHLFSQKKHGSNYTRHQDSINSHRSEHDTDRKVPSHSMGNSLSQSVEHSRSLDIQKSKTHVQHMNIEKPKVAYSVDEIYKEADRLSEVGSFIQTRSQTGKSMAEQIREQVEEELRLTKSLNNKDFKATVSNNNSQKSAHEDNPATLKDYDKRLSKSGLFKSRGESSEDELDTGPQRPNKVQSSYSAVGEPDRHVTHKSFSTDIDNDRLSKSANLPRHSNIKSARSSYERNIDKGPGLLAKASLDTATDIVKPVFQSTMDPLDEVLTPHGAPEQRIHINHVQNVRSPLTPEDHVEGIKQHLEIK